MKNGEHCRQLDYQIKQLTSAGAPAENFGWWETIYKVPNIQMCRHSKGYNQGNSGDTSKAIRRTSCSRR